MAHIEIKDKEGTGQVKLQTWGPNTKKKMATIQVIKSNKGDIRHVNILASKIVKPLLDKLLNGETINKLAKTFFEEPKTRNQNGRYSCTICGKGFEMERYMKAHMTRMHDTKLNLVKHAAISQ